MEAEQSAEYFLNNVTLYTLLVWFLCKLNALSKGDLSTIKSHKIAQ